MFNQNQIHLLEQYHKEMLCDQERKKVEQWLDDEAFSQEADAYFQLLDGFAALELEAFDQKLQLWEAKHKEDKTEVVKPTSGVILFFRKYKMAVAAAVILLMMPISYWAFMSEDKTDRIFADNFTHYKAITMVTRTVTPAEGEKSAEELALQMLLNQGVSAYNAKNYTNAIDFLERYLKLADDNKKNDEVNLYLAISKLTEDQNLEAKAIFGSLADNSKNMSVQQAADWYLALTLIKRKEPKAAKKQLKKIARNNKHRYQEKAEALLPQLKQLTKD